MTTATTTLPRTGFLHWRGHAWLGLAGRLYLGFVFLMACYHKIVLPESFALDVATYQFLPLELINIFALVLPWVELVAGIMLVIGYRTEAAALLIALMMVAFMIGLAHALGQGYEMSCGCFASSGAEGEDPISGMTLVRDGGWLAVALYVLFFDRKPLGVDGLLASRKEATR